MRLKSTLSALSVLSLLVLGGPARADGNDNYVRLAQNGQDAALQCAVGHFRSETSDVEIVLYGVVHIADEAYYQRVQADLDSYEVVLYEGVAPGSQAPSEQDKSLFEMQQAMGELLGLTFQKDGIDYTRGNLVHADMNMDQLTEAMGGQSLSPFGNVINEDQMQMIGPMMKQIAKFGKMFMDANPNFRNQLKMQMASQFNNADLAQGLGERAAQVILIERNKVVMEVLQRQLQETTSGRIAIFYGAAHMPDFEERLAELGFQRVSKRWMSAWQIGNGVADDPHTAGAPTAASREHRQPSIAFPARPRTETPAEPETAPSGARWFK